jgi:hypothetical protein
MTPVARTDYCPECNSTDVTFVDDPDGLSTLYVCVNGHEFDYDEARHEFTPDEAIVVRDGPLALDDGINPEWDGMVRSGVKESPDPFNPSNDPVISKVNDRIQTLLFAKARYHV